MVRTMVNMETLKLDGSFRLMTPFCTSVSTSAVVSGREDACAIRTDDGSTWVTLTGGAVAT